MEIFTPSMPMMSNPLPKGLIQYHEDYIEDLIEHMCKVDDIQVTFVYN